MITGDVGSRLLVHGYMAFILEIGCARLFTVM